MIRHIVLTKFKADAPEAEIAAIYAGLSAVTERLGTARNFGGGRSDSPEKIERGYQHGFTVDFDSWADLAAYAEDSEHKVFAERLVAAAEGGVDGVLVLDIPL